MGIHYLLDEDIVCTFAKAWEGKSLLRRSEPQLRIECTAHFVPFLVMVAEIIISIYNDCKKFLLSKEVSCMAIDVLTVSSKGQVVLPATIRRKLSIESGTRLAAYASDDFIMLKVLRMPTEEDFKAKLDEAQEWAASVGYSEDDVNDLIKSVRARKRK